jgi:hypothetical protein
MNFTEEDYKIMDIIIRYKPIYDKLIEQSFMYKFDMNEEIYDTLKVEVENLDTKKKSTETIIPVGYLKDNTFFWAYGGRSDIIVTIKNNINKIMNKHNLSQKVLETVSKFFNNKSFELTHKYRQIIPVLLSLLYDNDIVNFIRFGVDEITENFAYFGITVPLKLENNYKIEKEVIISLLKNFGNNKMSRNIPINRSSKKTSKKNSKKTSKRKSIHKISRSVNKLFFK